MKEYGKNPHDKKKKKKPEKEFRVMIKNNITIQKERVE